MHTSYYRGARVWQIEQHDRFGLSAPLPARSEIVDGALAASLLHHQVSWLMDSGVSDDLKALWVGRHRIGMRFASRMARLLRALPTTTVQEWERRGELVDSYNMPTEDLDRARFCCDAGAWYDRLSPGYKVQARAFMSAIKVPGVAVELGTDENGNGRIVPVLAQGRMAVVAP